MPNKVQGVKDDRLRNHERMQNWFNGVTGLLRLNRFFQYDPAIAGNIHSHDSRPSTRSTKNKNRKAKAARRANRRNRV